jgi:hypothetical protein
MRELIANKSFLEAGKKKPMMPTRQMMMPKTPRQRPPIALMRYQSESEANAAFVRTP